MAIRTAPPGPTSWIPGKTFLAFKSDRLGFLTAVARKYGDIVHFKAGLQRYYLVGHPDLIQEAFVTRQQNFGKGHSLERARDLLGQGLLTSEGEHHRRQRRLVQPGLHRSRLSGYAAVMVELAQRQCEQWRDGEERDLHADASHLTLRIVAKTLFDISVEDEAREIERDVTAAMEVFFLFSLPFADLLFGLPLPIVRRYRRARERLHTRIERMIKERRESDGDRGDLLSMLIRAQDNEADGSGMTSEQVRDEAITLFLAGHETTANALAWTFYLLSQSPEAEERLHHELDDVLGDRLPSFEDYPRLRYVESVVAESMRLYPPVWCVGRRALRECEIGGYTIPAGSIVLASQWVTHHDPRFFPDPWRFDPARFAPAARAARPHLAYFPFGAGPRLCAGEAFAWMEGVLAIATVAQRWKWHRAPGAVVEPLPLLTLRPKHGLPMILKRRQDRALV